MTGSFGFKSITVDLAKHGSLLNDIADFIADDALKHNIEIKTCLINVTLYYIIIFSLNSCE